MLFKHPKEAKYFFIKELLVMTGNNINLRAIS